MTPSASTRSRTGIVFAREDEDFFSLPFAWDVPKSNSEDPRLGLLHLDRHWLTNGRRDRECEAARIGKWP